MTLDPQVKNWATQVHSINIGCGQVIGEHSIAPNSLLTLMRYVGIFKRSQVASGKCVRSLLHGMLVAHDQFDYEKW